MCLVREGSINVVAARFECPSLLCFLPFYLTNQDVSRPASNCSSVSAVLSILRCGLGGHTVVLSPGRCVTIGVQCCGSSAAAHCVWWLLPQRSTLLWGQEWLATSHPTGHALLWVVPPGRLLWKSPLSQLWYCLLLTLLRITPYHDVAMSAE